MAAEIAMATQARTVFATIKAHGLEEVTKAVRFAGETFADLKARLAAANLPGLSEDSFFEVKIGEEFVCLLDSEVLPSGDIHVRVFTLPTGNGWHKPVDSPQEFYTEQYGPYHYGHHHYGHHGAEEDSHGFEELGKENCTEKDGKKDKHKGKGHHHRGGHRKRWGSHSRSRSRGRSHSPGRRSHSPRCRGMRGRHMHHGRHGPGGPHCGPHPHHRGMRRGLHHFFGMHHSPRHFGIHFHGPPGMSHSPHFAHGMPPFPGSLCPACNSGRGEGEPSASMAAKEMGEQVAGLALVSSTTGDN